MKEENERVGNYLLVYLLDGKKLNVDIFNWKESQLNGNKPWIISDKLEEGYADVSSISNWDTIGRKLKDYYFVREEIKNLYKFLGNSGIDENDARILSQLFILPKEKRDIFYTEEEQFINWTNFLNSSMECRNERWEKAKNYISYNLEPIDSTDLAIDTTLLCENYIKYNIINFETSGKVGLLDYLEGTYTYSETGFTSKTYFKEEYKNKLIDIILNGN